MRFGYGSDLDMEGPNITWAGIKIKQWFSVWDLGPIFSRFNRTWALQELTGAPYSKKTDYFFTQVCHMKLKSTFLFADWRLRLPYTFCNYFEWVWSFALLNLRLSSRWSTLPVTGEPQPMHWSTRTLLSSMMITERLEEILQFQCFQVKTSQPGCYWCMTSTWFLSCRLLTNKKMDACKKR